MENINQQFVTYLNENKMIGLDELVKDPKVKTSKKK